MSKNLNENTSIIILFVLSLILVSIIWLINNYNQEKENIYLVNLVQENISKNVIPINDSKLKVQDSINSKHKMYKNYIKKDSIINLKFELNSVTELELEKFNGIGKKLSERIIKFKNKLGGYTNVNQLKEVYGLDTNLVNKIKKNFTINLDSVKKIDIKNITFKELLKHPYFEYDLVKKIFYKKELFLQDCLKIWIPEKYEKIKPYLK